MSAVKHQACPTPGIWHRNIKPATKYNTVWAGRNTHVAHAAVDGLNPEEVEANIDLIVEAGTVYHVTGLTPSQLAEHRDELLDALRDFQKDMDQISHMCKKLCIEIYIAISKCEVSTS
jgi:Tat protein secretion system quality control protein TatD with DNase activity